MTVIAELPAEEPENALAAAQVALEAMRARKDAAYHERNVVVSLLATMLKSGIARTDIPGWHASWHNCVYIDFPDDIGQVSFHFHDDDAPLFAHLPPYEGVYDGHTKADVFERFAKARVAIHAVARQVDEEAAALARILR